MKLIPIILSGGAGTRLWPVSRRAYPKPFMQLSNGSTLAELTFQRALEVSDDGTVMTVTSRDYYFICRDMYKKVAKSEMHKQIFMLEPMGRNTAPAIALAALEVQQRFGDDAVMLVMPSDHLIKDKSAFKTAVNEGAKLASLGYIATFGIFPTSPETGYGYIKAGDKIAGYDAAVIAEFKEKPDLQTAKEYVASGNYSWNSGMFCLSAKHLLAEMQQTSPAVLTAVKKCFQTKNIQNSAIEFDTDTFAAMPDISIDYAVMEKAKKRAVVDSRFDWNDIGSWNSMAQLAESDECGNRIEGKAITVGSKDCYIRSGDRIVAAVGVENLMIVDTKDAVLVAHRDRSQGVKDVVQFLKANNHEAAIYHQTVHRPWGSYTILEDEDDCKVKRLVVKPGQILSLQKHQRRSEHWTVVSGTAKVRNGDKEFLLESNQSTYIPTNTLHRLENPTNQDIALIEVQCGDYFGEDDIERFEDIYGRTTDD
ncbi:Mannose-1-phosphate guanylyltransferase / Mannose-6-phosphate isomerase [hydrothermal vent metagenome]|uniref:mannose-1-phosphate guanylyltransferase n=1 Tax=hydrothermal vent metagenome TaxID=652676 RepID=A0A3B0V0R1_9ZZZZ